MAGEERAAVEQGGPADDRGRESDEVPWRGEQGGQVEPHGRSGPAKDRNEKRQRDQEGGFRNRPNHGHLVLAAHHHLANAP